jgi:recombination associated protein RdgC
MFKNAIAYRLLIMPPLALSINNALDDAQAEEIGSLQGEAFGWQPYEYGNEKHFAHYVDDFVFFKLNIKEKLIPAAVLNRETDKKVKKMEADGDRLLSKKERSQVKDEVYFELLPKAFVVESTIECYLDLKNNLIVVDTSSIPKAEKLLSFLRRTLGGLNCVPINTKNSINFTLTNWVTNEHIIPANLSLTGDYKLSSPEGDKKAGMKGFAGFSTEQVSGLINDGGQQVIEASLQCNDDITFSFDESFRIKSIGYTDSEEVDLEDAYSIKRRDCFITGKVISGLINIMIEAMGGEEEINQAEAA